MTCKNRPPVADTTSPYYGEQDAETSCPILEGCPKVWRSLVYMDIVSIFPPSMFSTDRHKGLKPYSTLDAFSLCPDSLPGVEGRLSPIWAFKSACQIDYLIRKLEDAGNED